MPHFTSLVWPMVPIKSMNLSVKYFQRSLISSPVNRIFVKAPSNIIIWKEVCPEVPLPPGPVLTRWGSWISTALFYAKNRESQNRRQPVAARRSSRHRKVSEIAQEPPPCLRLGLHCRKLGFPSCCSDLS